MGQVQVELGDRRWGSICGEEWDIKDATVICRQLGMNLGSVVARPRTEFGSNSGPVVMSKVNCYIFDLYNFYCKPNIFLLHCS